MAGEELCLAIAQDQKTGEVLMAAFMNKEALEKTLTKGTMHYFSTSRKKIWHKGEESGHFQKVREVLVDCDGDALLFKVDQAGAACHEGYYCCFFRKLKENRWQLTGERVFNPDEVY
jgi:phosphoribosyl-AMP cyclohydrolase